MTPSSRCSSGRSRAGGDLREAAGLRRVLPGPRLLPGRWSPALLAGVGRGGRGSGDSGSGLPAFGCRDAALPSRRVGAAGPRGKDAASEISDVFLLLPGAAEALRMRPGDRGRNQAGIPPQGLKGCSGLWCLQVIRTARCCRSRQSPLSFLGWGRGEDAVNTKHDLAGGKKIIFKAQRTWQPACVWVPSYIKLSDE